MIISTWNVNSLKSRLPLVIEWLKYEKPDILMLQEIKGLDNIYPKELLKDLGYNSVENLQATYNGVAILSLHPITVLNNGIPNFVDAQARFIEVLINDLKIINIYAPNGNPITTDKYTYKLNWFNALYNHLNNLINRQENFVIAGDFNIIPNEHDVYKPESFTGDALFQTEIRQLYSKILNLGLTDVIDIYYQEQKDRYTWWDYRNMSFEKNNGARIDHILLSSFLANKLAWAKIDKIPRTKDKPSDHTPVVCKINV